jgi:hypothetical protein
MPTEKNVRRLHHIKYLTNDNEDIARELTKNLLKSLGDGLERLREADLAVTETKMFELFWKHAHQFMRDDNESIRTPIKVILIRVMGELDGLNSHAAYENLKELLPDW